MQKNKNETVLITGASSGLGRSLAIKFGQENYNLILCARNKENLKKTADLIKNDIEITLLDFDLCDIKNIEELARLAINLDVKILINNAGLPCFGKPLDDIKISEINAMIATNFTAPILITRLLYQHLKRKNNSAIININSIIGREIRKFRSIYGATKWGLRGFCESLALEARENGVNILNIFPTAIKNDYQNFGMDSEYVAEKIYEAFVLKEQELILDGRKK